MIAFVALQPERAPGRASGATRVMSLAATATMVLMLLLLAGFWIVQTGLLAGLQFIEQKVEVVAYLQAERQADARSTTLQARLEAMPEVATVDVRRSRGRGARALPRLDWRPRARRT